MENIVKSVALAISTNEGKIKEIPLETWQVDVISEMLGLCIRLPDLDDYQMSARARVDERMAVYHKALKAFDKE